MDIEYEVYVFIPHNIRCIENLVQKIRSHAPDSNDIVKDLVTLSVKQSIVNVEKYTRAIFDSYIRNKIVKSYTIIPKVISSDEGIQIRSYVDVNKNLHMNEDTITLSNNYILVKVLI